MADPKQRRVEIIEKLKKKGHKLTPQRLAVVKILAESKGHPSVEQIYAQLKTNFPTMSLATVYRNVMLLKSLGELLELGFPDGSNRYDGNKPYPHVHIVCVHCKRILDPDLDALKDVKAELVRETEFEIVSHRIDFFGICKQCKENGI